MKNFHKSNGLLCVVTLSIVVILLPALGHAQTTQTYNGGTGTWDLNTTPNWSGSNVWTGGDDNALFNGATNTVTVDNTYGQVTVDTMEFASSGATIVQGGPIEENPFTTQNYEGGSNPGTETFIQVDGGSGPVTITSQIVVSDLGENQQDFMVNNSSSTLTIGDIDFGAYTVNPSATNARRVNLEATGSGAITINGTYTTSAGDGGSIIFGSNDAGTYNITSSADFTNFNGGSNSLVFDGNTLNIDNSTFNGTQTLSMQNPSANSTVNLVGAQTIALSVYDSMKNSGTKASDGVNITGVATFIQSTADQSTWTGSVNQDGSSVTLGAVAGGRLTWSGNLGGDAPEGLVKTGAGVVVLANAAGNSYDERDGNGNLQPTSTVAADIQQGTLLITNTSGSAFGIVSNGDAFYDNTGPHNNQVNIESGATLGGTGISTQPIDVVAAGSIIAPGDPGQSNLSIDPTIGTLHLTGGVTASSGLTLAFKLSVDGLSNDKLDLGAGAFSLSGPVTVDFTSLGTVLTDTEYLLASGSGAWSDTDATFTFNGPDGYRVESYDFDTSADTFSVEFMVAPEPATWVLLGLGILALLWQVRRKDETEASQAEALKTIFRLLRGHETIEDDETERS